MTQSAYAEDALAAYQLGPWPRAVRYDLPVEEVGPDEVFDMQNVRIGTGGQLETRKGTDSYYDTAAIAGAPTGTLLAEIDVDASTTYVVECFGTKLYKNVSGTRTDITGGLTVTAGDDNTFEWADANGVLVITNGVDTDAKKWTGTGNFSLLDDDARFTKGKHIAWFDNRLWIGNVNGATGQLWYSDTADIETWGATSFYNFGGIILGLVPAHNALIVHTTDGIYTLVPTGNSALPYHPDHRTETAGIDGRTCVSLPGETQLMLQEDGVYEWRGGGELVKVSPQLDGSRYWDEVVRNKARLTQAFAVHYKDASEVWFFLPHGASQTNMNHVMIYNYRLRTQIHGVDVGVWYGPDTGFERNAAALVGGVPHAVDFVGVMHTHDDDVRDDNGANITQFAETGAPAPYGAHVSVGWIAARHYYDAQGDYSLTVQQLAAEIAAPSEELNLQGVGLYLDSGDYYDSGIDWGASGGLQSADTPLLDYSPQMSIKLSMNAAGQQFSHRRILLLHEPLGTPSKADPVDE